MKKKKKNRNVYLQLIKRPMDTVLALLALVFLFPFLLIIGLIVRINLGAPVFFVQKRPGLNEKVFSLYKFRTMNDFKDKKGMLLPDEIRLTKFGRLLRKTSLDELPELFNILKGDMSIVGPRPLLQNYLPYYTKEEKLRHSVRPGLTGLSQIKGRNLLDWTNRFLLDLYYVKNISFFLDLKIICTTLRNVLHQSNITMGSQHVMMNLDCERKNQGLP